MACHTLCGVAACPDKKPLNKVLASVLFLLAFRCQAGSLGLALTLRCLAVVHLQVLFSEAVVGAAA